MSPLVVPTSRYKILRDLILNVQDLNKIRLLPKYLRHESRSITERWGNLEVTILQIIRYYIFYYFYT